MRKAIVILLLLLFSACGRERREERREEAKEERREERHEERQEERHEERRERHHERHHQRPTPPTVTPRSTPWTGILNPARAIDWSTAGIPGGIPNVTTQCGQTLQPSGDTTGATDATAIQNAVSHCSTTTNSFVQLAAGTFYAAPTSTIVIPTYVVLRGMGADQTIIRMVTTSTTSSGASAYGFTLGTTGTASQATYNRVMGISSTNSKGDTTITVTSIGQATISQLQAGQMVWIADLNDWFPSCAGPNTVPTSRCINTASDVELSNPGGASATNMDFSSSQNAFGQRAAGQMNLITNTDGVSQLTLQDPLVDSFRHSLPDWVANSPANPITGFNRGMAIHPSGSTHVYVQGTSTQTPAPGYCRTGTTVPTWPTNGTAVTESVSNLASVACGTGTCTEVACSWTDHGVGTDSIPRLMYWVPAVNVGLENLQIFGVNNLQYGNFQSLVQLVGCKYCWIRGIEINGPLGFITKTSYSYHGQIEQNYYTTAWYHGSGTDSVIDLDAGTSGFLVQNNIFERTPEGIFTDNGGSGNVIAYNYALGTWGANSLNSATATLLSHDAWPWFNLLEGNMVSGMAEDGIHGGNGFGTKFRNWARGTDKICQPVSATGLTGGLPTRPPGPANVTTNAPGSTTYYYAAEIVVAGAQSVPSSPVTFSTGPATLSSSAYNTITAPNCPTTACLTQTSSSTPPPNAPTDRCLIYRCATSACSTPGTMISPSSIGVPCDGTSTVQDTGQASTGVGMSGSATGSPGAGASMVPRSSAICTPLSSPPSNSQSGVNAWFAYQGLWTAQNNQYSTSFNNVGNVTGSQDFATVATGMKYPERRKACAICDSYCADNTNGGTATCTVGQPCPLVSCGTTTSRNFSWLIDESFGFGTGTVCLGTSGPCHDSTLAQDTVFHCQNYFRSLQAVEAGDCPSTTVLPPSFFLVGKPAWWGNAQWPPIGPDVSGGLANSFGFAYNIPAKNCYENVMHADGLTDPTGAPNLKFNAAACYSSAPPPMISAFSVAPSSMQSGGSAMLSWTVSNATTVSIDNGIGSVAASGSQSVSPAATTTYTLTATNANGNNVATTVLTVGTTPPPITAPSIINGRGKITGQGKIIP